MRYLNGELQKISSGLALEGDWKGSRLRVGRLHLIIGLAPRALIMQFATNGRARPPPPPPFAIILSAK